jgi:lipopolysaccharide export system permease protein
VRIISRHFLASYLRLFFAVLFASLLALTIIEMLLNFDRAVESGTAAGVAAYFLMRIPSEYLRDSVSVSSFVAALLCIGGPARARELIALRAGGISPLRVTVPVVLASILLSLVALVVDETVVLSATRSADPLAPREHRISFRRGSFWYHRGDTIYNILDADRDRRTLHGVSVFRLNGEGRLIESLHADRVRVEDDAWLFADALRRSFDPAVPEAPPRVERVSARIAELGGRRDLASLGTGLDVLSLPELIEYVGLRALDGRNLAEARGQLHRRLADPLAVFLFAWLALPLGFGVERTRSLALPCLLGIAWISVYFSLRTAASMLSEAGIAAAAPVPWALLALFAVLGALRLTRVPG